MAVSHPTAAPATPCAMGGWHTSPPRSLRVRAPGVARALNTSRSSQSTRDDDVGGQARKTPWLLGQTWDGNRTVNANGPLAKDAQALSGPGDAETYPTPHRAVNSDRLPGGARPVRGSTPDTRRPQNSNLVLLSVFLAERRRCRLSVSSAPLLRPPHTFSAEVRWTRLQLGNSGLVSYSSTGPLFEPAIP